MYFQPLSGGASRPIIPVWQMGEFSVVPLGIYYVPCQPLGSVNPDMPVRVLNPVTGDDRQVATLEIPFPAPGLNDRLFRGLTRWPDDSLQQAGQQWSRPDVD